VFDAPVVELPIALATGSWSLAASWKQGGEPVHDSLLWMCAGGIFAALTAGLLLFIVLRRPEALRMAVAKATEALQESHAGLERRVAERTASLQAANTDLKASQQRFQDFAQSSADWFWETDGDLRFTYMSPNVERILGVRPEWHYGKTREELVGEGYDRRVWDDHFETLKSHRPFRDFNYLRVGENIEPRWLSTSGVPMFDTDGTFLGYRGTARDITAQKRTEEALQQALKMEAVGQLTGGVAHDFNNLLGVIIGNLDFLAEELAGDTGKLPLIDAALGAAESGANLNRQLLAFSRKQVLKTSVIDLSMHIHKMLDMLNRTLGETIAVHTRLLPELQKVEIDTSQFDSALLNLVVNARHAMPAGGQLTIETENTELGARDVRHYEGVSPGRYVMVSISDTGTGMSPEIMAQVFDPFFTTKDVGEGSGLGLSMVFGFVKQSRGHVTISSVEGAGTTIRLYFPVSDDEKPILEKTEPRAIPKGDGQRVLIVEDDEGLRTAAKMMVTSLGYRAVAVPDGEAALAKLNGNEAFDVMFVDVVLPRGMNGVELVKQASTRNPAIRVLFTSGYTNDAMLLNGVAREELELLSKPYRRDELARALGRVLEAGSEFPLFAPS
jgi:PAS domain S-box-containing protein